MMKHYLTLLLTLFLLLNQGAIQASTTQTLLIVAASDLRYVMAQWIVQFQQKYPHYFVKPTYMSSGKAFAQIAHGAPFDIFYSANEAYPQQLQHKKLTLSVTKPYALGYLVLWSTKLDPRPQGMKTLLLPSIQKIALANPQHAPYGQRAVEALKYYGVYAQVQNKLVYGENINQALQFGLSGNAQAALVALSLVKSNHLNPAGLYWLIPAQAHQPLRQAYVVLKPAQSKQIALHWQQFVSSAAAKQTLQRYGFTPL